MKPTSARQPLLVLAVLAPSLPSLGAQGNALPVVGPTIHGAGSGASAERRPLDLEALQQLASQHNPTLVQAEAHVQAETAKAMQAGLYPNPRAGYIAEPVPVAGTRGEFSGVFLEQQIVSGGKLKLSRQKYEARSLAAAHLRDAQELRVRNDVRIRYFRVLGAAEVIQIREAQLRNAEDRLATVDEMVNLGQADASDAHFAKASRQRSRLDWLMATNSHRAAVEDLAAVVGADLGQAAIVGSLEGEIQVLDFEEALDRLLEDSPELAAVRQEVAVDEITLKREKREPLPNVVVNLGVGRDPATRDSVYRASVSVQLPLFDRNRGAVLQAQADLERQRAEVYRRELLIRRMLAKRYSAYLTALQHVRDYREVVLPASRNAYQARLLAYGDGREDWPRVLDSQSSYYRERAAYVAHLTAWREEETAIQGMLLVNGLTAAEGALPAGHIDAIAKPR